MNTAAAGLQLNAITSKEIAAANLIVKPPPCYSYSGYEKVPS
jgi:hypothetical protein